MENPTPQTRTTDDEEATLADARLALAAGSSLITILKRGGDLHDVGVPLTASATRRRNTSPEEMWTRTAATAALVVENARGDILHVSLRHDAPDSSSRDPSGPEHLHTTRSLDAVATLQQDEEASTATSLFVINPERHHEVRLRVQTRDLGRVDVVDAMTISTLAQRQGAEGEVAPDDERHPAGLVPLCADVDDGLLAVTLPRESWTCLLLWGEASRD